jgi:hypothetical protein
MDNKGFKNLFGEIAKSNSFLNAFGGWFKESTECITILELQKSNFGNYYILNIKIFIQGFFGKNLTVNKDLIKSSIGYINTNETTEFKSAFDLDELMDNNERKELLITLFQNHINPFVKGTSTKLGIIEMHQNRGLFLLPSIKKELGI